MSENFCSIANYLQELLKLLRENDAQYNLLETLKIRKIFKVLKVHYV